MAFLLTPRFAPAYQAPQCNPFGFCAPVSRPTYAYRVSRAQPRRPTYSPFNHFFSQVDDLLSEIDQEAQRQAQAVALRQAHRQRQQKKRALRAKFTVSQQEQGWQVDGDIHGFDQENISIEILDDQTVKIAGNTEWQLEKAPKEPQHLETAPLASLEQHSEEVQDADTADATLNNSHTQKASIEADSDTESHKSYQATVEDDFEDLGAEASSIISASSGTSTPAEPQEPKGKEKAFEESATPESVVVPQTEPAEPTQQPEDYAEEKERNHGSFERTFRFPERFNASGVTASFKDGALKITVPKAQLPQVRRIAIA